MTPFRTAPSRSLFACFLLALLPAVPAAAADEAVVDGVLHVRNGETPTEGVETLDLEELWRVGGDDEDSLLLGVVSKALLDDEDNIYLLDAQLSQVEVLSPEGEHLRTLGREGDGPGEFRAAFDMVFMPDGNLGVVQTFPGRIIKLALDGTPAGHYLPGGDVTSGGLLVLVNCLSADDNLVLTGMNIDIDPAAGTQTRHHWVRRYLADQTVSVEYHTDPRLWDFTDNFTLTEDLTDFVWARFDVAADGKVAVGIPRLAYEITVFNPDGSVDRVIERAYSSRKRGEAELALRKGWLEGMARQLPAGTPTEVSDMEQDIQGVFYRQDGSLWVQSSRNLFEPGDGMMTAFDVFDPQGVFVKRVDVKGHANPGSDAFLLARGDLFFRITGFFDAILTMQGGGGGDLAEEPEPMEVICYRIR